MKIVCFGDSNTYGYDPRSYMGDRYDAEACWVSILEKELACQIVNAGENGREVPHNRWQLDEFGYLMEIENPVDLLMIMLGTNDLLQGNDVSLVVYRMESFLKEIDLPRPNILLIAPPIFKLGEWIDSQVLIGESSKLADAYRRLSARLGVRFVNANDL